MDYIEGDVLSKIDNLDINLTEFKKSLTTIITKVHSKDIIVYDLRSRNLILDSKGGIYIYDFSDALHRRGVKLYFMDTLFEDLKRQDNNRLETIIQNLYD
jgi:tRNA A-37 threonylcarbamoyl transferase component Bud32